MWKHKSLLIGVLGVLLLSGLAHASAAESREGIIRLASLSSVPVPNVRYISGEITWVDVKLGKLQLREDSSRGTQEAAEYRDYRMNQQATNVTDPSDKKFLTVKDLRPGQRVAIEFEPVGSAGEKMARKITVEPTPDPVYQEAFGEIEAIDVNAGTFVLENRPAIRRDGGLSDLSYFLFEPKEIVVMKSPSKEPVRLEMKPGDPVKVEYVVKDGKQWIHSVTLYSPVPEVVEKTTTTTTTTSITTKE